MADDRNVPEPGDENESLEGPNAPVGDDRDIAPIGPQPLDEALSEQRSHLGRSVGSFTQLIAPVANPLVEKLTSDHLTKIIDNEENEGVRADNKRIRVYEERASRRRLQFIYFLVGLFVAVGMIVLFTFTDNRDMIIPIVTAVAAFLGGFAAGQRFRN